MRKRDRDNEKEQRHGDSEGETEEGKKDIYKEVKEILIRSVIIEELEKI